MNIRNRMISEAAANIARIMVESGYDRAKVQGMVPTFERTLNEWGHVRLMAYYSDLQIKRGANK